MGKMTRGCCAAGAHRSALTAARVGAGTATPPRMSPTGTLWTSGGAFLRAGTLRGRPLPCRQPYWPPRSDIFLYGGSELLPQACC